MAGQTRGYVVVVYSCSVYSVDRASNVVVCVFSCPRHLNFLPIYYFFSLIPHTTIYSCLLFFRLLFFFPLPLSCARQRHPLPPTERRNNNLHISSENEGNMPTKRRDLTDTETSRHVRCPTNATKNQRVS